MPITCEFSYCKPKRLKDALELLSKPGTKILSGGTDLIVKLKEDIESADALLDIKGINQLQGLKFSKGILSIGALVTFTDLIDSSVAKSKFPLIWEMAQTVASVGVRNRATVAGNICSAVPSADSSSVLQVYDAEIIIESFKGQRRVSINDWFLGPKKTVLQKGEMVIAIEVPLPKGKHGGCYAKLSRYEGEDLAQGGISVLAFSNKTYRVAFCALGPKPERAYKTENALKGKLLNPLTIKKAKTEILKQVRPITDMRSGKDYRLHMTGIMLNRALNAAFARINGKGPKYGDSVI
ncbi:MAG: xanthine dehydrogenase family protein subunit M [Elusimicrobiales bacterium]|nr:xanthine dehydrogenase family protein subunit M [Elusimicrobiales bacterium]